MWQRIQTAIILVAIVGVAMFAFDSPYPFLALLLVGNAIASNEWTKLLPKTAEKATGFSSPAVFVPVNVIISSITLGLFLVMSMWWTVLPWWILSVLIWLMAISWVGKFPNEVKWFDNRLIAIGIILLTSAMSAMFYLWSQSPWWLMYVFILVWCADSGAYFVGRKFGKKKMAPNVSPNKSMEGLYGGLATGLIAVLLVSFIKLKYPPAQLLYFLVLSAITIMASVFGDLFESMLKRQAGVKDSGTILPGHGGVLDRIDSLLSATPIFALGFWGMQLLF